MVSGSWVLLAYRVPREPSTPRIALWRALRRLGAAQLLDGLVALPADERTREQLDWLADGVIEAGGEASVWVATPGTAALQRGLQAGMKDATGAEYRALQAHAEAARETPVGTRKRTLARLRRELRLIERRDFFVAPQRKAAQAAVAALARSIETVSA